MDFDLALGANLTLFSAKFWPDIKNIYFINKIINFVEK